MIYAGTKNLARPVDGPAIAGESIGTTLTEQIFVERGAIATMRTFPPYELRQFKARVFWLGRKPLQRGRRYQLKLVTTRWIVKSRASSARSMLLLWLRFQEGR